jgi:short-subunit dehydrogenase involved in D-alanine esterification of teichoic acids
MQLVGKKILVTGGPSGIGLASEGIAHQRSRVAISGRRSAVVSSALAELHDKWEKATGIRRQV